WAQSSESSQSSQHPIAVYDLADLVEAAPNPPEAHSKLGDVLTSTVQTDKWVQNGGDQASLYWLRDKLIIRCPKPTHDEVAALLAKIRKSGIPAPPPTDLSTSPPQSP